MGHTSFAVVAVLLAVSAHATLDIIEDGILKVVCDVTGKHCPPATASPSTSITPTAPGQGDNLLLTQTQVIGTFQSYHQAPSQAIYNLLNSPQYQDNFVAQNENIPTRYAFSHPSITQQLQAGIRGFEFDTLDDPQGGRYAYSAALKLTGAASTLISPDLLKPGIKAMSLPDWDFGSSCYLFAQCLSEIANFSAANPTHFPIVIFVHHGGTTKPQSYLGSEYTAALAQLEANTSVPPYNFTQGINAMIPDIKTAILSEFRASQIYTPDNLRADNNASATANLHDIVFPGGALNGSWPTIARLRGKIMFFADPDYTAELDSVSPGAINSLLWPSDDNGDTDPNVVVLDGMVDVDLANYTTTPYSFDTNANASVVAAAYAIQAMTLQGFYVRAGVDSTAVEAQFDYTQRANKFQSPGGAQFLSTFFDVPPPQNLLPSPYQINTQTQFGGAVAVCNPVLTSVDRSPMGSLITMGSVAYPFDGGISQLGGTTIIQPPLPACPVPVGFSA